MGGNSVRNSPLALVTLGVTIACSPPTTSTPELTAGTVVDSRLSSFRSIAVALRVDAAARTAQTTTLLTTDAGGTSIELASGASASLLGSDAIRVQVDEVRRSAVGAFLPGLVRVTMNVRVTNVMPSVRLMPATWPTPPSGRPGLILIPFESFATVGSATIVGAAGGTSADVVAIGIVRPSVDWSDGPYNFFSAAACRVGETLCSRYITFEAPLQPRASTSARRVGFDVEPTVKSFRANLLLAADLANAP